MNDLTHIAESLQPLAVPTAKLKRDPKNANTHSERSIRSIMGSLRRFGQQKPVVALRSGTVIAGNGTLEAAERLAEGSKELGLEPDPRWESIAVSRFANRKDAIAYAIADNQTAALAEWDFEVLAGHLSTLDGALLDATGFDTNEAAAIIAAWAPESSTKPTPPQPSDDDFAGLNVDALPLPETGDTIKVGRHRIHVGDCVATLKTMADCSVDSIVTDPPYGIGFMGKGWDCSVPTVEWAKECLRVLKPGGHIIAFAATRTMHRLAVAVEDAGFEIRDQIAWLQWQGFPKSLNVSKAIDKAAGVERKRLIVPTKPGNHHGQAGPIALGASGMTDKSQPVTDNAKQWDGWGTALKPSYEPAILARKPLVGTVAANVTTLGTGAINIDGCRLDDGDRGWPGPQGEAPKGGRWPANIYHCPKPARGEREKGTDALPAKTGAQAVNRKDGSAGKDNPRAGAGRTADTVKNHHPTVKPVGLMRWLVRLVTPPGGTVVDSFLGSGTTMVAADREGFTCVGIEMDPEYARISHARTAHITNSASGAKDKS